MDWGRGAYLLGSRDRFNIFNFRSFVTCVLHHLHTMDPSDSPLVPPLVTFWWPVWQWSLFDPCSYACVQALVALGSSMRHSLCRCATEWAMPARLFMCCSNVFRFVHSSISSNQTVHWMQRRLLQSQRGNVRLPRELEGVTNEQYDKALITMDTPHGVGTEGTQSHGKYTAYGGGGYVKDLIGTVKHAKG